MKEEDFWLDLGEALNYLLVGEYGLSENDIDYIMSYLKSKYE